MSDIPEDCGKNGIICMGGKFCCKKHEKLFHDRQLKSTPPKPHSKRTKKKKKKSN